MKRKFSLPFLCFLVIGTIFGLFYFAVYRDTFPIKHIVQRKSPVQLDHIVILLMENESDSTIVGSRDAPYLNSLMQAYSSADNYFAVSHPSLPNYLALLGGNTFGITSDCMSCHVASTNIIDELEQSGKSWKAYMESMPEKCFVGNSGLYAQKHNPFMYFNDIVHNQKRCNNIVPYTQLHMDLQSTQTTSNFIWITPNLCDDMHDCPVAVGDKWLSEQVPLILNSPAFIKQKSLLVITWDEGENSENNKVPAIFIGNMAKKGFVSHQYFTHYSLLHTIENVWNMSPINNNVAQSSSMTSLLQ